MKLTDSIIPFEAICHFANLILLFEKVLLSEELWRKIELVERKHKNHFVLEDT